MITRKWLLVLAVAGALSWSVWPQAGWARTWVSKNGKFKIDAELLEATDTEVLLRKANRDEVKVRLDKLCDDDNKYVERWKKERGAAGAKKPGDKKTGDKPNGGKANGGKLTTLEFKIFEDEFTIQAPAGAKAEIEGVFPTISQGKKFKMSITPNVDSELADFKERFAKPSDAIALKKTLVEEDDALAYKVNMKAFNAECSVYMVIVTIGDKKFTCSDVSLDEINQKEKRTPKDIELMVQCARTLKAKGASDSDTPDSDDSPTDEGDDDGVPLASLTIKPFVDDLTVQAPEGAEVSGTGRITKGKDFDFEVQWTDLGSALEDFKQAYANTELYTIKSVLLETEDALAFEIVKNYPKPAKKGCVFLVTRKVGEHQYNCRDRTFLHENPALFNKAAVMRMIRCARSLELK